MLKLCREIVSASGAKIFALLTGIITLSLTGRILGPGGRGVVAAVSTWVALVSTFGYLSLGQVAIHKATLARDGRWLAPTLGSLLFLTGILTLIGWLVAGTIYRFSGPQTFGGISPALLAIGFAALPFLIWEQYGSSLLIATDRIAIYNRAQVLGRSVGFALVVITLAFLRWGVPGALISTLVGQAVISGAGIRVLWREAVGSVRSDWATVRELLSGGAKLHLNAIGTFLFMSTDVLIVNRFRGPAETGHYQLAVQLAGILLMIPQGASTVLYGRMAQSSPDAVWPLTRKLLALVTLTMCAVGAVSAAVAPWVIPAVVGREFAPSIPVFQLLMLNLVGMTFSTIMAPQWIGRGLFLQAALITLCAGILNFGANCALVPRFGMYGSLWATLGTYMVAIAGNVALAVWVERHVARPIETAAQVV